jgi:hypothetical protein
VIGERTTIGRRTTLLRVVGGGALAVLAAAAIAAFTGGSGSGLVLEHNGLLTDRAFTRAASTASLAPTFRLGGTATMSDATVRAAADGLHVGVGPHQLGTWRGFYVATAASFPAGAVIHVQMTRPSQAVPLKSQSGIALLAVQTAASRYLDYVLVAGVISRANRSWIVGYANGSTTYARTKPLDIMPSASTSEDITLRTDGSSSYTVFFGNRLVYRSTSLRLNVAPPLRVYLEVEARGFAYQTQFRDFWVAANNAVTVEGLSRGDQVTLTPDGKPAIRARANAAGKARLVLPLTEAVGEGTLKVHGPHLRRRFAHLAYAGGDVYQLRT